MWRVGDIMGRTFKFFILLSIILLVFTGCSSDKNETDISAPDLTDDGTNNDTTTPGEENPDKQEPVDNTPTEQVDSPKSVAFSEAFPENVLGNPEQFVNSIIPGFEIGLTKDEIQQKIGKPDLIEATETEWGKGEDWLYDNIKDYQIIVSFTEEGYLTNFKIVKQLSGRGIIPKITNKQAPADQAPITFSELGYEGVILGTTTDDVLNRFGEPFQTYLSKDEMYGYTLALVYRGITINVFLENNNSYVQVIETNSYGSVDTYRGIHVGSSVDDVIAKYGKPPYDWQQTGDLVYATEDYWFGIKFTIKDDKVSSIYIYEAS